MDVIDKRQDWWFFVIWKTMRRLSHSKRLDGCPDRALFKGVLQHLRC